MKIEPVMSNSNSSQESIIHLLWLFLHYQYFKQGTWRSMNANDNELFIYTYSIQYAYIYNKEIVNHNDRSKNSEALAYGSKYNTIP